ncbi:5'-methylthioadenosine/S-adenosylhomocysteine nucleosidase family protein [Mycobacterium alsense]|uniref:5'-methylthioadenosine/S-adenosylhomocysteine nucleosidase family protein n=1 Tax=Mycobacterium alsense TaxID=324058 RepID=UPI001FD4D556|nr:5'-methylthioadenosine/S-adenosylhomocysteine nucleosidase [Mycobacterium alsense]
MLKPFRAALVAALAASAGAGVAAAETGDAPNVTTNACEKRTLVLSAFPAEADAVLSHTALDPSPVVVADRRHFYLGTIGGKKVIVAMTGIGLVNATQTAETAFARFTCPSPVSIGAVVFSGLAGGGARVNIADVAVPARWTTDGGATFHPVDPGMLAAAQALSVDLESVVRLIDLKRAPRLVVGGDGFSTDNNNGRAFPCIPNGGDVFGCQPCSAPDRSLFYTGNFFQAAGPWLKNALISNLSIASTANPAFDATDNETAAVQAVADAHGTPFLGIRSISDGAGDPLGLPGFPFEFFFYKQIAADNAARVTAAFLRSWARV